MKLQILLILLFNLICTSAFSKSKKSQKLDDLYETIELTNFLINIKKIKSYKTLSHIDKLDYELKRYYKNLKSWSFFDVDDFKKGLDSKLSRSFSLKDLDLLAKKFKNPFLVKFLNSMTLNRDLFHFHQEVLNEKYKISSLPKSRVTLLKSLYNIHGLEIHNDNLLQRLGALHKSKTLLIRVLANNEKSDVFLDPAMIETRLKNTKEFILDSMARDIASYRHYEIREYVRVMQDKSIQKFLQLYTNYHFLYVTKYVRTIETDKINQLQLLEIKE
jgi:hypothetical protein